MIDGVVLAHVYLTLVDLRLAGSTVVRQEMLALFLEHLRGNLPGRVVDKAVACSLQPGKAFLLKGRNVDEGTVLEEIVFHVLHDILHLALCLGIFLAAEQGGEVFLPNKRRKILGQYGRAQVLLADQHLVLVVYDRTRLAAKELEGQFMGIYRLGRVEGRLAEVYVLLARTAHDHDEEVHFHIPARGVFHPPLAKINLGVFAICRLNLHLI